MANEDKYKIGLEAEYVKGSGDKAINDVQKDIKKKLPKGYIEIPAEVKVPLKGKELQSAQKKVLQSYEEAFKTGASSFEDRNKKLESAYKKFKKLAKDDTNAQTEWITNIIGSQIDAIKNQRKLKLGRTQSLTSTYTRSKSDSNDILRKSIDRLNKTQEQQLNHTKIGNNREAVADSTQEALSKENVDVNTKNTDTGLNTDENAKELIEGQATIPEKIASLIGDKSTSGFSDLYRNKVERSNIYASPIKLTTFEKLQKAMQKLTGTTEKYEKRLGKHAKPSKGKHARGDTIEDQEELAAQRIVQFGLNNSRNPNDTGDIASIRRSLALFRTNKSSIELNPDLMQDIKLTPSIEIDTTEVMKRFNKELSGRRMRNAQMGGSPLRQIFGSITGFIGMPSIEKSRAIADGLNQAFGNINEALQSVLTTIQTKETELIGLEKAGKARFDDEGRLEKGSSSAAIKTFADLEEEKLVLKTILADMKAVDKVIGISGKNYGKLIKQLKFTSPVLRENNDIIRNLNAGLDKGGKALKFQSRTAEIMNYTFQLLSRHIGQMVQNWILMLNPINVIKKAFGDFASYNTKWQRTINVVKYNLRSIIAPMMDKIAQLLVNMIGFADIISMKIQKAFGNTPISLFDQENANKFKETVEEINNVSAGFDELHDIGTEGGDNDPNDLLGEIYKPKLSKEWEDLANKIGDLFSGIITGDMGFGEVMKTIIEILGQGLALIGKTIWNWLKNTTIGKYISEHWKGILATLLAIFLAWKGLKIFGPKLISALFGGLSEGGISGVAAKIGTLFGNIFSSTAGSLITGALSTVILGLNVVWAHNTVKNMTYNWDSLTTGEKILGGLKLAAQNTIGALSGAGLGAAISALGGPITALGGAIIGFTITAGTQLITWATTSKAGILELADAQEQARQALQLYEEAVANAANAELQYRQVREQLTQLEKEAGITGEELYEQVKNGTLSVHDMTDAQLQVLSTYMQVQEAMEQVNDLEKKVQETKENTIKKNLNEALSLANTSGNWDDYKQAVIDAIDSNDITVDEGRDYLERAMADMDESTRKTFVENIPDNIKDRT